MLGTAPLGAAPLGASGANPKPLGTYVLQTAGATFALTGGAATFKAPATYTMAAGPGTFLLLGDGQAIEVPVYPMPTTPGVFSFGGTTVMFSRPVLAITLAPGAFTLSGGTATGGKTKALVTQPGAFVTAGQPVAMFKATYQLHQDVGNFALTLTGSARNSRFLFGDVRRYALTGRMVRLKANGRELLETGTFALTGSDGWMVPCFNLKPGGSGIYKILGPGATVARRVALRAEAGSFLLTGDGAVAQAKPVVAVRPATFNMLNSPAALVLTAYAAVPVAGYTLTGLDASTTLTRRLKASTGTFARTGQPVDIHLTRQVLTQPRAFVLAGGAASAKRGRTLALQAGSLQISSVGGLMNRGCRGIRADGGRFYLFGYSDLMVYVPSLGTILQPIVPKPILPRILKGDPVLEQ